MPDPSVPRRPRPLPRGASGGADRPDPGFWGEGRPRRVRVPRPPGSGLELLRDRFQAWRSDARLGVVLLVVVAVVAGVLWYRIGVAGGGDPPPARAVVRTSTTTRVATTLSQGAPASRRDTPGALVVHVAGAVTRPGVVELGTGSRVIDAIEAAGGAVADADLNRLNLAAKLVDGQRVLVPRVGEALAAPDAGSPPADGADATAGPLNVNTATQAQLEELPGIGPALAAAIIDERGRRGGFRSVNELRDVRGIGEKRFADLRDKVTV